MEHLILIAEEGERNLIEHYLPNTDWPVLVTGVGGVNVVRALRNVPRDTHVLNIGYAGSANFAVGTIVEVTRVYTNHPNCTFAEPELRIDPIADGLFPIADCQAVCYTSSDFVLQSEYKDCVFDMELAYIAAMGFSKISALKLVSDNLSLHAYHELTNGVE